MRLVWGEKFRTGIREMDLQHQGFIEIVNDLEDFCQGNAAQADLDQILAQLSAYAEFHFETKEALMGNHLAETTPHYLAHSNAHARFSEHIQAFRKLPKAERQAAIADLLAYLKRWLEQHIMGIDKKLAELITPPTA